MQSPVVPTNTRTRLTRDYTSDESLPKVLPTKGALGLDPEFSLPVQRPSKGTMGLDPEFSLPVQRPGLDVGPGSFKSDDGRITAMRDHRTMSPQPRESAELRKLDSAVSVTVNGQSLDRENQEQLRKLDFSLESVDERSNYEPSISAVSHTTQNTALTSSSSSRLPDFFAPEVFQVVLHNPTTSHQLLKFSQTRLCGENMAFLEKVDKYNTLLNEIAKYMFDIHRDFISVNADNQINIAESMLIKVNKELKAALTSTLPRLETVFVDSQNEIERLVATDIYPRFVRHQMSLSASKALAGDRGRYAGLGDCFVLTDPAKADNPIVYASDGFVKVTGYSRNEIIPRNCRFLQTRHTDASAVKRLRQAIQDREESVELLLNNKKSGEPFWNLLYTAPLFDSVGNVVFFLGGQINCSTTIHNATDVLKILSQTGDTDEHAVQGVMAPEVPKPTSRTSRFLSSFRTKSQAEPSRQAGMEDRLLNKIEKMNLRKQMDTFYTAYSKYIIINHSTYFISFHSAGMTTLLYPTKVVPNGNMPSQQGGSLVGMDIFRFLAQHSPSSKISSDFKSRVKTALKYGNSVSMDLTLCTRRYMGFEKLVSHWTPLKNEVGEVGWVVVSLGGQQD